MLEWLGISPFEVMKVRLGLAWSWNLCWQNIYKHTTDNKLVDREPFINCMPLTSQWVGTCGFCSLSLLFCFFSCMIYMLSLVQIPIWVQEHHIYTDKKVWVAILWFLLLFFVSSLVWAMFSYIPIWVCIWNIFKKNMGTRTSHIYWNLFAILHCWMDDGHYPNSVFHS